MQNLLNNDKIYIMKNILKSNRKEGGFLKLIILIVIALFLMSYFKVSLTDIFNWLKDAIANVIK
jgi:hypothetical protein